MYFTVESLVKLEESKKKYVWYHAGPQFITSVDFSKLGIVSYMGDKQRITDFIIGDEYILEGMACRGFKPRRSVYKIVGLADSVHGVPINGIIAKHVSGDVGKQYTLGPDDCALYDVEYEEGLVLFPKQMNWSKDIKPRKFDPYNLATTPMCPTNGRIFDFLLKIGPFKDLSHGNVVTPSGKANHENVVEASVMVKTKMPIVLSDTSVIAEGTRLECEIVRPTKIKGLIFKYGNFIGSDNSMYLHVNISKYIHSPQAGILPEYIEGIRPSDMFDVIWDETNAMTEEELMKKELAARERVRRKEEKTKIMVDRANKSIDEAMAILTRELTNIDPILVGLSRNLDERIQQNQGLKYIWTNDSHGNKNKVPYLEPFKEPFDYAEDSFDKWMHQHLIRY